MHHHLGIKILTAGVGITGSGPISETVTRSYQQSGRMLTMDLWRIWAKALGEKASSDSQEADKVALIRTLIVGVNFITCFFIMANTVRHW